jgi:hypothetical protein
MPVKTCPTPEYITIICEFQQQTQDQGAFVIHGAFDGHTKMPDSCTGFTDSRQISYVKIPINKEFETKVFEITND